MGETLNVQRCNNNNVRDDNKQGKVHSTRVCINQSNRKLNAKQSIPKGSGIDENQVINGGVTLTWLTITWEIQIP